MPFLGQYELTGTSLCRFYFFAHISCVLAFLLMDHPDERYPIFIVAAYTSVTPLSADGYIEAEAEDTFN